MHQITLQYLAITYPTLLELEGSNQPIELKWSRKKQEVEEDQNKSHEPVQMTEAHKVSSDQTSPRISNPFSMHER